MSKTEKEKPSQNFWVASPGEVLSSRQRIETYLYVFGYSLTDFTAWLQTTADVLFKTMGEASIVDLKNLENECFNFCRAKSQGLI
jgi:hypothetical protein